MLTPQLEHRDRRLLRVVLVLGATALVFVVINFLAEVYAFLGDILLTFFLAWLLAFILSPLVNRLVAAIPSLPRGVATVIVYTVLVVTFLALVIGGAAALATSVSQFIASIPSIRENVPSILEPWQRWLESLGFGQIDLAAQASEIIANLDKVAGQLVQPLQQLAVASIGVVGTLLITLFLSIYMVLDRDDILAFLFRLVPPTYTEEAMLLQTAVSRSFGGYLRGQALMGVVYFLIALVPHLLFGLPLGALSAVTAGVLMAIPFFGPFVAWAPPVVISLVFDPTVLLPTFLIMVVGWFVVMNILQPRIMQGTVGIHPLVVFGAVLIGMKVAGVPGAIFGIPIAAVLSAFFFHFLNLSTAERSVSARAAKRVERREGRPVRVPQEPLPGTAEDLEDVRALASTEQAPDPSP